MGRTRLTEAQKTQRDAARKNSSLGQSSQHNSAFQAVAMTSAPVPRKTRTSSTIADLNTQIAALNSSLDTSKDEIILLKSVVADLEGSNQAQSVILADLSWTNERLRSELTVSESTVYDHSSQLSAALSALTSERDVLKKCQKRVKRLENDKRKALIDKRKNAKTSSNALSSLETRIQTLSDTIASLTTHNEQLQSRLSTHQQTTAAQITKLRAERKAWKTQAQRAQGSLAEVRRELKGVLTWNAKTGHIYSMETRQLVLRIAQAGCPEHKIKWITRASSISLLIHSWPFIKQTNSLLLGVDQERKQIVCGFVDTIGSCTFAKTLEYKAKQGLNSGSKEVTVIPPTEY